jgi:hypothetical protein
MKMFLIPNLLKDWKTQPKMLGQHLTKHKHKNALISPGSVFPKIHSRVSFTGAKQTKNAVLVYFLNSGSDGQWKVQWQVDNQWQHDLIKDFSTSSNLVPDDQHDKNIHVDYNTKSSKFLSGTVSASSAQFRVSSSINFKI